VRPVDDKPGGIARVRLGSGQGCQRPWPCGPAEIHCRAAPRPPRYPFRVGAVRAASTPPVRLYQRLAQMKLDWGTVPKLFSSATSVFVPPDHKDFQLSHGARSPSGQTGLVQAAQAVRPFPTDRHTAKAPRTAMDEDPTPAIWCWHAGSRACRCFILTLLGLGDDGHTASLLPGQPVLEERQRWGGGCCPEGRGRAARITLTYPALDSAN